MAMEAHCLRPLRRQAHAMALCLAVFWQCLTASQAQQTLAGHSIAAPPSLDSLASRWTLSGTVIPSQRSLVMQPGVPNRLGLFWNKFPLLTNDFEVKFKFTAKAPEKLTAKEEGMVFWYVYENVSDVQANLTNSHLHNQDEIITNNWGGHFVKDGFDLFGYRGAYDGYAVFFYDPSEKKDSPQMMSKVNDGKTTVRYEDLRTSGDILKKNFRDGSEIKVTVRIQPTGAKVEFEGGASQEVKGEFKPGGYIGFSIFGGQPSFAETRERSDFVELYSLEVINHDKSSKGEDVPTQAEAPTKPKEEKVDIIGEASSFKDHRAESEAIKELTNMVFKLVVESQPLRNQMVKAIESLGRRVTVMEQTFDQLKKELDKKTGHKLGEEFEAIKKELSSLSKVASSETQERHRRLDSLHEDIAHVHKKATSHDNSFDQHLNKLTESNQRTMDSLTNEHQKMFGVSIAAIAFIIVAGFSLYHKFSCWEKKHIL